MTISGLLFGGIPTRRKLCITALIAHSVHTQQALFILLASALPPRVSLLYCKLIRIKD